MTRKDFKVIATIIAILQKGIAENVDADSLQKIVDGELRAQNPNYNANTFWSEVEKVKQNL